MKHPLFKSSQAYNTKYKFKAQGPSAPNGRKCNVRRICGGSRSYLKSKI